jgi:DNA gyrase subunit B
MDPETRTILQVTVEDALLAPDTCERLLGDHVESRSLFIEENAKFVSNLDMRSPPAWVGNLRRHS